MKTIALFIVLFIYTSAVMAFDRESALSEYKEQCQLNLVLAMGLSAQKESGKSQKELEKIAANSKNPELMAIMVSELFSKPELQGRTVTLYNFESCLISKANKSPVVSLIDIRAPLKQCEEHSEMAAFVNCIDSAIANHRT